MNSLVSRFFPNCRKNAIMVQGLLFLGDTKRHVVLCLGDTETINR
jgi:hypothetical protein